MKYIITESQLEKSIFKYLDMEFGGLESEEGENFDVVFKSANGDYNEFGWDKPGTLTIQRDVTEKLTDFFMLDTIDSFDFIGSWFKDRYNLPVNKVKFTRFMLVDKKFLIH
jgi:hypothetical protein